MLSTEQAESKIEDRGSIVLQSLVRCLFALYSLPVAASYLLVFVVRCLLSSYLSTLCAMLFAIAGLGTRFFNTLFLFSQSSLTCSEPLGYALEDSTPPSEENESGRKNGGSW